MKNYRTLPNLCITLVLLISFAASCKKDDNEPVSYSYFVSKELVAEYSATYINSMIDIASLSVPEVAEFKASVAGDVEVYKIVYETTVDGNKINASGLISVPATKGEYPLLSFQNGTNTVYASAPSEKPKDYSYQMIEIMASMGYVVVFADYPGFGVSTQIPHPYLVKDPTVTSLVDLLYAAREISDIEFPGITIKNEEYLLGYSQGGWATLALHKALEFDYSGDFNLAGSSCGAGPYNTLELFESMADQQTYPMPVYPAYIMNAYTSYHQFTNPVSDIFNEPYASRVPALFNGNLTSGEINNQLTTSIPGLLKPDFISGYKTSLRYSTVIRALTNNSVSAWHTNKPVLFTHGGGDTQVNPISTESIYNGMIAAGTSSEICKKVIVPNVDHGAGVVPCLTKGILFLNRLKESNN